MTVIKDYFKDVSKILKAQYELSSNLSNRTLIGSSRELFIKNFFAGLFPKKYVIGQGEIIDSDNNRSNQADVVIYDEYMPSFDYGDSRHFLSTGVLAHIEIKSTLDTERLNQALEITKSVKALKRDIIPTMAIGNPPPKKISSFLFAYDGVEKTTFKDAVLSYYNNPSGQDINNYIDGICVLNKYVMLKDMTTRDKCFFLNTGEDSLAVFFVMLFQAMYKNWMGLPNFNSYLGELSYPQFYVHQPTGTTPS